MGVLQRFGDIMKANINALLDKAEDPAKMVDQMLLDLRKDLADVKKETAAVMANEKDAKRQFDDCQAKIDKYVQAATNAVKQGEDDDARKILEKKQGLEQSLTSLRENYQMAQRNADQVRALHDKLVNDIESLETRKASIKAKVATAKAQEHVNKVTAGTKSSASLEAFDRLEKKANAMLDSANAEAELNKGVTQTDDLVSKYGSGSSTSVEDELAKIKAGLA